MSKLTVCFISDTHCMLNKVKLPEADLLVHSGDWTFRGTIPEIAQFNEDLGKVKHLYKYGIVTTPGNHDWLAERNATLCKEILNNCTILIDESIEIEGLKIYGSPWQPFFCNWAFNLFSNELKEKWKLIPTDTDILVTHGPPYKVLDLTPMGNNCGCIHLTEAVTNIKPLVHVFGHIHDSYGTTKNENTLFVNASTCDESYKTTNKPIIIEINDGKVNEIT